MDRTERFYKIQQLLANRRVVSRETFLEELEISLATFKRDLEALRDRFHMPIVWDREAGGYRLDESDPVHTCQGRRSLSAFHRSKMSPFRSVKSEQ